MAASFVIVFHVVPSELSPKAHRGEPVSEQARTWTPEQGWSEQIRRSSAEVVEEGEDLVFEKRVSNAHSPRGAVFEVPVEEDLRLVEEPGARMAFPAVGFFEEPAETVFLAVPWSGQGEDTVRVFDRFEWVAVDEREGLTLVEYHARHGSQALLHGDHIWFRQAERSVLVEPVTGSIVDYEEAEALWSEPYEAGDPRFGFLLQGLQEREKVWEASVSPSPAAQQALVEEAKQARNDHALELAWTGGPVFVAGQALLFAGLAGWPRRAFGA